MAGSWASIASTSAVGEEYRCSSLTHVTYLVREMASDLLIVGGTNVCCVDVKKYPKAYHRNKF